MNDWLNPIGGLAVYALCPILPAYLWLKRIRPELVPGRFLLAFGLGLAAVVPALLIQYFLPRASGRFAVMIDSLGRIAVTEELSRYALFRAARRPLGTQPDNGAKLGLAAGLGFVFFEDLVYLSLNPSIALARLFGAIPIHAACASRVGEAALRTGTFRSAWVRLAAAVLIHGTYNILSALPFLPTFVPALFALAALGLAPAWRKEEKCLSNT